MANNPDEYGTVSSKLQEILYLTRQLHEFHHQKMQVVTDGRWGIGRQCAIREAFGLTKEEGS